MCAWENALLYARREAVQELAQQLTEEERRAEENHRRLLSLAKMLKSMGWDKQTIIENTGLSTEEVENL